ncbi:MAG: serine/threonine protein kinase [Flavobacteriia bacterium]|nr:serine/threonine protein kinase [Flavobacteriia bacterium]
MIGREILNYRIEKVIGEGGMGTVYLASHTKIPNRVSAIKVLKSNFLQNENLKNRFRREMEIMAGMTHENIVKLEQFDEDDLGMYLIMEYFKGVEIDDYLKNKIGVFPEEKAVPLMIQILKAFSFAHKKGIVHRDIKPGNILINQEANQVKVLDFGIAKMKDDISMQTKSGAQIGTVFYMSPEQVHGKELDARSDIYALGVTFYQMLTGINPYHDLNTEYEIYNKITKEDLPDPREIYPGVSERMVNILRKSLAKAPEDRFQTCDDFILALQGDVEVKPISKTGIEPPVEIPEKTDNTPTLIAVFIGIASVISLLSPDFYWFSPLFSLGGVGYFLYTKNKNPESGKPIVLIVFSALVISLLFSVALYMFTDSDGDSFPDRNDPCPEYGINNGCP